MPSDKLEFGVRGRGYGLGPSVWSYYVMCLVHSTRIGFWIKTISRLKSTSTAEFCIRLHICTSTAQWRRRARQSPAYLPKSPYPWAPSTRCLADHVPRAHPHPSTTTRWHPYPTFSSPCALPKTPRTRMARPNARRKHSARGARHPRPKARTCLPRTRPKEVSRARPRRAKLILRGRLRLQSRGPTDMRTAHTHLTHPPSRPFPPPRISLDPSSPTPSRSAPPKQAAGHPRPCHPN